MESIYGLFGEQCVGGIKVDAPLDTPLNPVVDVTVSVEHLHVDLGVVIVNIFDNSRHEGDDNGLGIKPLALEQAY